MTTTCWGGGAWLVAQPARVTSTEPQTPTNLYRAPYPMLPPRLGEGKKWNRCPPGDSNEFRDLDPKSRPDLIPVATKASILSPTPATRRIEDAQPVGYPGPDPGLKTCARTGA